MIEISPKTKRILILAGLGLLFITLGAAIFQSVQLTHTKTVKQISIYESSTDWYSTGPIIAQKGDRLKIDVTSTGGNAKLKVESQDGKSILSEVEASRFNYDITLPNDNTYTVYIWTRAWPFSSTFVAVHGSIVQSRIMLEFFPAGYAASALILVGVGLFCVIGLMYYRDVVGVREKSRVEQEWAEYKKYKKEEAQNQNQNRSEKNRRTTNSHTADDPYTILGVSKFASRSEVVDAYRRLAKEWHPDKFAKHQDPKVWEMANEKFKKINAAYEEIKRIKGWN